MKIIVNIKAKDLYDYMMYHIYHSAMGIIGNCIGGLIVVMAAAMQQWLYVILGCVILGYIPWTLFIKSKKQALATKAFREPLTYTFDEEGMKVAQNEIEESIAWEQIYKAVSTMNSIIIYTTEKNATIIPKRDIKGKKSQLLEVIFTHLPPNKVKIKG